MYCCEQVSPIYTHCQMKIKFEFHFFASIEMLTRDLVFDMSVLKLSITWYSYNLIDWVYVAHYLLRVIEFYKLHITKSIFSSYFLDTNMLYNACNIAHYFMTLHDKFYSQSSCANVCFNDFFCLSKHEYLNSTKTSSVIYCTLSNKSSKGIRELKGHNPSK